MKTITIILFSLLTLSSFNIEAQTHEKWSDIEVISFTYQDGVQRVQLDRKGNMAIIRIANNEVVALSVQNREGKKLSLGQTGAAKGSDCPCGQTCWEDEEKLMSICVCRPCGGGGSHQGWIDVLSWSW